MRRLFEFITILIFINAQAFADKSPHAFINVEWERGLAQFSGQAFYEMQARLDDKTKLQTIELNLYPNRYLQASAWAGRENLELSTRAESSNDAKLLRQRGSLFISNAEVLSFDHDCKESLQQKFDPVARKPVQIQFNKGETVASLKIDLGNEVAQCQILKINFIFSPPYSVGNFGVVNANEMHFSGPFFPFPKNIIFDTEINYKNLNVLCAQCQSRGSDSQQFFRDFPAPIHLFSENPTTYVFRLWNREIVLLDIADDGVANEIIEVLNEIASTYPFEKMFSQTPAQRIFVVDGVLIEKLVLRHPYELQLGNGFLKTNILFRDYHKAALARAILTELLAQHIHAINGVSNTSEFQYNLATARWLAEVFMRRHHKGLDGIQKFSERLKFLPLFNDIIQGKALVNNDVFLGKEENETPLDSKPLDLLRPTFNGAEIQERVEWCFDPSTVNLLERDIDKVLREEISIKNWLAQVAVLYSDKCKRSFVSLLSQRTVSESIEIEVFEKHMFSTAIEFKRQRRTSSIYSLFQSHNDKTVDDVLFLSFWNRQNDSKKTNYKSEFTNETKIFRTHISEDFLVAKVDGPNTDSSKDLQQYPRKLEFLLSGLKLGFNSNDKMIDGQTGLMWRLRGDKYQRNFTLNLKRELGVVYLEPTLLGQVFVDDVDLFSTAVPNFIKSVPLGLGLPVTLGNSPEVWISAQTGYSDATTSLLAPEGYAVTLKASQSIYRQKTSTPAIKVEASYNVFLPIARLLTLVPTFTTGRNTLRDDYGHLFASGTPIGFLIASNYMATNLEMRSVLAHNLKFSVGQMASIEHVLGFIGHNFVADIGDALKKPPEMPSAQSIQVGFRLYGSFFGAKDQMITFSLSRGLVKTPRNVFAFAIGR